MSELTVERRECRLYDIGPVSLEAVKVTEENIPDIKKWIREKTANDSKPALDVGGVEKGFFKDPTYFIGDWIVLLEGKYWANWTQGEYTRKVWGRICTCDACMANAEVSGPCAAKDLQRKCVLLEKEERYCEIAAKRMAQEVLPPEGC